MQARGKTLFMSDEEKHGHQFDLSLFFNMSKQFLLMISLQDGHLFKFNKHDKERGLSKIKKFFINTYS